MGVFRNVHAESLTQRRRRATKSDAPVAVGVGKLLPGRATPGSSSVDAEAVLIFPWVLLGLLSVHYPGEDKDEDEDHDENPDDENPGGGDDTPGGGGGTVTYGPRGPGEGTEGSGEGGDTDTDDGTDTDTDGGGDTGGDGGGGEGSPGDVDDEAMEQLCAEALVAGGSCEGQLPCECLQCLLAGVAPCDNDSDSGGGSDTDTDEGGADDDTPGDDIDTDPKDTGGRL